MTKRNGRGTAHRSAKEMLARTPAPEEVRSKAVDSVFARAASMPLHQAQAELEELEDMGESRSVMAHALRQRVEQARAEFAMSARPEVEDEDEDDSLGELEEEL